MHNSSKSRTVLHGLVAVLAATSSAALGQTNGIALFAQPANIRVSTQGTNQTNPNEFNTAILSLSCPQTITAVVSSTPDGLGNVLVDNYITFNTANTNPVNICTKGTEDSDHQQNCFNSTYGSEAEAGKLTGQPPDPTTGGVPPIDVSQLLSPGSVQATINLVDTGGYLTSSALYLYTNCTSNGIVGPGQVTGNPISSSSPTQAQLAQSYLFNGNNNQQIQFTYDVSQAQNAGTLTIPDSSTPSSGDMPIDPGSFPHPYLDGTSFATASCLQHTGELFNGGPACDLYSLTCQIGTEPTQAGRLCPTSQERNEIFQELFDGPPFTLPDIQASGLTFHQGVGFLETQDVWAGGPCTFDPDSSLAGAVCPQNVLTSFSGPGAYTSGGRGQSPNSSFITVAPVPEPLTTVSVPQATSFQWINHHNFSVNFITTPPIGLSQNNFVPSPIATLTYGISDASAVPPSGAPVANDTTLNDTTCPGGDAAVFTPPAQPLSVNADGQYLLHYMAQDCAGTSELKFTNTSGNWSTSFYTYPINVDTVPPAVATGPALSPAPVNGSYTVGQKVTASYSCTDTLSGVVQCGASSYTTGTLATGVITSPVDTTKPGPQTFAVNAVDAAGNMASVSVNYQVVAAAPVNLFILKLAPFRVRKKSQMTYVVSVTNLGKQTAANVVITDPLPPGVSFVKATAQQLICTKGKCSNDASCSFSANTVSCTVPAVSLLTPLLAEITVQVQASVGTKITNKATVSSANPEGSPGNTQSSASTVVY